MRKFKEFVSDVFWNIRAFILQPIIPEKSIAWIKEHNCSYSGMSKDEKWDYYWYGNFKTGYQVKTRRSKTIWA